MSVTLIVEDNSTFRRSLKDMLCASFPEMCIEEAVDGAEALDKVSVLCPDIVFMDIKLPGANGLELTRTIKARYPDMVVIILTSYDLPEYREAAHRSGANHFCTKGNTTGDEITQLVQAVIDPR